MRHVATAIVILSAGALIAHAQTAFSVEEGSLYPALQRMLVKGWVTPEWGATDEGRRAS